MAEEKRTEEKVMAGTENQEAAVAGTIEPVDVEKIMEEIRQEIREKGYDASMLSFRDVDGEEELLHAQEDKFRLEELERRVQEASLHAEVPWYYQAEGSLPVRLMKKVIRKLIRFAYVPIVESQNRENQALVQSLRQVMAYVKEQQEWIGVLEKRLEALEDQHQEDQSRKEQ